jgi:hypothetical protein
MKRERVMLELATAHAVALRLRDAGADAESIGRALGVPAESVSPLLSIAQAKLDALLAEAAEPASPPLPR